MLFVVKKYEDKHETAKEEEHEIIIFFRAFVASCFGDKFILWFQLVWIG